MTEAEWNDCQDAVGMMHFLRGKSGKRKLRLLACACARLCWSGLVEEEYRMGVEVAERYADRLADMNELRRAADEIWLRGWSVVRGDPDANGAASATVEDFSAHAAERAVACVPSEAPALIREIFGNPFRNRIATSNWPGGKNGRVRDIAQSIYDERRFGDLSHLADTLVAAGCQDEALLAHLRSPGPHYCGCWALDAVARIGPGKDAVTEAEWVRETHPFYMLIRWEYLRGEPSARKRRLLACACCRLAWPTFKDQCLIRAVETAETFADGCVGRGELVEAYERAHALGMARGEVLGHTSSDRPGWAELSNAWHAAHAAADSASPEHFSSGNAMHYAAQDGGRGKHTEDAGQARLIREILGNPFRLVVLDSAWLTWNDATIPKLAQMIYDERRFEDMPILADALIDAGCHDADILSHCRQSSAHVRACWVLDLLLGKG